MEISNKTLVWLVVATIFISMLGTILSVERIKDNNKMTAYYVSNDTGSASVIISTTTVLNFAVDTLNLGSGSVNVSGGFNNCTLVSNGTSVTEDVDAACSGFTTSGGSLILENDGNTYMSVTLNFSVNESSLFGPTTTAAYRGLYYSYMSNESNSCRGVTNASGWLTVTVPNASNTICSNLSWLDASDSLRVGLRFVIPYDAQGSKSLSILAQGTDI